MRGFSGRTLAFLACCGILMGTHSGAWAAKKGKASAATPTVETTPLDGSQPKDAVKTVEPTPEATATPTVVPTAEPTTTPTAEPRKDGGAKSEKKTVSTFGPKSPATAGALAFFPGLLVHGSGHFYAGSHLKGLGLLTMEGASGYLIYRNISEILSQLDSLKNSLDNKNGSIPTDFSFLYVKGGIVLGVGIPLFLFSWLDDISGAPIATIKWNEKHEAEAREANLYLNLTPLADGQGAMLSLKTNF